MTEIPVRIHFSKVDLPVAICDLDHSGALTIGLAMGGLLRFGGGTQLWPDEVPVIGAKVTAGDDPTCCSLNGRSESWGCRAKAVRNIAQVPNSRTAGRREACFLGGIKRSEMVFEVHSFITSNDVLFVNIV